MSSTTVNVFETGGKQLVMRARYFPTFHLTSSPSYQVTMSQIRCGTRHNASATTVSAGVLLKVPLILYQTLNQQPRVFFENESTWREEVILRRCFGCANVHARS